jgi:hypothetical protein
LVIEESAGTDDDNILDRFDARNGGLGFELRMG